MKHNQPNQGTQHTQGGAQQRPGTQGTTPAAKTGWNNPNANAGLNRPNQGKTTINPKDTTKGGTGTGTTGTGTGGNAGGRKF